MLRWVRYLLQRNALVLGVAQSQVHVLCEMVSERFTGWLSKKGRLTKALSGSSLEEVVNGGTDNNTLTTRVDSEATNLDAVASGDVLD